jgi:5'-AMP-activated protein kinase regulatory beta subunit
VGSTNSPIDDYGMDSIRMMGDDHDDSLSSAIPPLDDSKREDDDADGEGGALQRHTFRWTGQADSVAVAGSFNNWTKIPLRCVGHHEYVLTLDLNPVQHQYKYIVDGKWQHDPLAPVVASGLGSLNNLLNVSLVANDGGEGGTFEDFEAAVDVGISFGQSTPPGEYSQSIPEFDEADAPPLLPPHLKEATLNSEPLQSDSAELPIPNHVVLDHLYAQSVKDSVLVLGATQRYRRKYITTVLHKPI